MKRTLSTIAALLIASVCFGWGGKGHDVIAYIAECNLEPEVYAKVTKALGNHSLVYYANWLDNASHTEQYAYTKTWHYANVDEGYTYDTMDREASGDVVTAINAIYGKLKSHTLSPEEEGLNLRMLIHLMGDLHAPLHGGRRSDRGGNNVYIKNMGRDKKLHSYWDSDIVEFSHKWSYTEWQQQIDRFTTEERKAELRKGTVKDWFDGTHRLAVDIYANTPAGTNVSFDYTAHYAPVIEACLEAGGVRLAMILTDIYR